MPRRGEITKKPIQADPKNAKSLRTKMAVFLEDLAVKNYSKATIEGRDLYLGYFLKWCEERGVCDADEVTKPVLEQYQRALFHYRKKDGAPLAMRSQHARLVAIRSLFKWLAKENHLLWNPASEIELPKLEKRLPKHILTISEMEKVLNTPDTKRSLGIRDRAMLETLYSTGVRRMELIGISIFDVDEERGTLVVRQGKGRKDRMVPIGDRALNWIEKYLVEVRPKLVFASDNKYLFLTTDGDPFSNNRVSQMVRDYVDAADIGKRGSCHLFRHTVATLMLENGADIRYIQALLGHSKLETTEFYTQVSIRKLKEVHDKTHPARIERGPNRVLIDDDEVVNVH